MVDRKTKQRLKKYELHPRVGCLTITLDEERIGFCTCIEDQRSFQMDKQIST
eukprot:SAG31_NODE_4315_length_3365_cov_1.038579_5_plen_52_part_00